MKRKKLKHRQWERNKGFTLVELMVSLAIASALFLGVSLFFSGTFQNLLNSEQLITNTQDQFVVSQLVLDKLAHIEGTPDSAALPGGIDHVTVQNGSESELPLTLVGAADNGDGKKRLVMKDFLPFTKVIDSGGTALFGDPGAGTINNAAGASVYTGLPPNFAGFIEVAGGLYATVPDQNEIVYCTGGSCSALTGLSETPVAPTDLALRPGTNDFYVSDSGNNRVLLVTASGAAVSQTQALTIPGLNFPSGLAYYANPFSGPSNLDYLFVADTLNHQVKRVPLNGVSGLSQDAAEVVAGLGESDACNNTARYCKLSFPTGLFIDAAANDLYLADSGHNRVLKISDPGKVDASAFPIHYDTSAVAAGTLSQIELTFPAAFTVGSSATPGAGLHKGAYAGDNTAKTFVYKLFTELMAPISNCTTNPFPAINTCDTIRVKNALFDPAESVVIDPGGPNAEAQTITGYTAPDFYTVNPTSVGHLAGEPVVMDPYQSLPNPLEFSVDLTGTTPALFNPVELELSGSWGSPPQASLIVRGFDGVLGSKEDTVSVVSLPGSPTLWLPTGVAKTAAGLTVADALNRRIHLPVGGPITYMPYLESAFGDFDYVSDFEIATAPSPLTFKAIGSGNKLLQMTLKTKLNEDTAQTTTLNATLP